MIPLGWRKILFSAQSVELRWSWYSRTSKSILQNEINKLLLALVALCSIITDRIAIFEAQHHFAAPKKVKCAVAAKAAFLAFGRSKKVFCSFQGFLVSCSCIFFPQSKLLINRLWRIRFYAASWGHRFRKTDVEQSDSYIRDFLLYDYT